VKKIVVSLKIERPYETIPVTFDEDEVLVNSSPGGDFGATLQKVSKTYNLNEQKRALKANKLQNVLQLRLIGNAIRASPQREEKFLRIQNRGNKGVRPVQDVKTRWDSTYAMCIRALRLREFIDKWIDLSDSVKINRLRLLNIDWSQVEYVIALLYPFYRCTQAVSRTKGPGIHKVWRVYNGLFEHLEKRLEEAQKETVRRHSLCSAIQAGMAKFSEYYAKTADAFGDFYAVAAVLDPTRRFNAYNPSDWTKEERKEYYQKIEQFYKDNYATQYEQAIQGQQDKEQIGAEVKYQRKRMIFERTVANNLYSIRI